MRNPAAVAALYMGENTDRGFLARAFLAAEQRAEEAERERDELRRVVSSYETRGDDSG